MCRFLVTVVCTHWKDLGGLSSDRVVPVVEKLVHRTAQNPEPKYPTIDKAFPKFPSYLRRAAIMFAVGQVSSYMTQYWDWQSGQSRNINQQIGNIVSKRIIQIAQSYCAEAIVFENLKGWKLKGGKKRSNRSQRFHGWLKSLIEVYILDRGKTEITNTSKATSNKHLMNDLAILNLAKVPLQNKQLLPEYSGIYYVLDEHNIVWYIGQAKNINKRWQGKNHHRLYQLKAQKKQFTIYYEKVDESQLDNIEKQRIEQYYPHLNTSPVKKKKLRPTETLLRETLAAISDFAFVLAVEPPRQEIANNIREWLAKKKVLNLKVIHICLDFDAIEEKFKPESIEEREAIIKTPFVSRKAYANKWEQIIPLYPIYRLYVNGYAIEVNLMSLFFSKEINSLYQYDRTTLAQESIKILTPESLAQIQQQIGDKNLHIKRLHPYTSDPIDLGFNETIDRESIKNSLEKVSNDYKKGLRGVGSRSNATNVDR